MSANEKYSDLEKITYDAALGIAWERLAFMDPGKVSENSIAQFLNCRIIVRHFQNDCIVDLERRTIEIANKDVGSFLSILTLHYLIGCSDICPTGRFISFREVPAGDVYYSAFKTRTIDKLQSLFGTRPGALLEAGKSLGAKVLDLGSTSIQVQVFPKMPVTVIVWEGDEEVPSSANILFDELAPKILPTEDLVVISSLIFSMLKKSLGAMDQSILQKSKEKE